MEDHPENSADLDQTREDSAGSFQNRLSTFSFEIFTAIGEILSMF